MALHRSTGRPDWETANPAEQNGWQRTAVRSHGILTPGNFITIGGFLVVLAGLFVLFRHAYWAGLIVVGVGRLCDVLDGWVAELTGTKSPLGETLDATFDKIGTGLTILTFGATGITPWWAVGLLIAPHLIISAIILARLKQRKLHPSPLGKFSMALAWVGLLGFVIIRAAQVSSHSWFAGLVYTLSAVSVLLGFYIATTYARQAFGAQPAR